jgi:hypothetical protein
MSWAYAGMTNKPWPVLAWLPRWQPPSCLHSSCRRSRPVGTDPRGPLRGLSAATAAMADGGDVRARFLVSLAGEPVGLLVP